MYEMYQLPTFKSTKTIEHFISAALTMNINTQNNHSFWMVTAFHILLHLFNYFDMQHSRKKKKKD